MKVWQCSVCKYIHTGDTPPAKCPVCGADASRFVEIDEASIPEKIPGKKNPTKPASTGKTVTAKPALCPGGEKKTPTHPPARTGFEKIKSLLVKHHAHPVSVHTPNGILPASVILWLAALMFSSDIFAKTALQH